MASSSTTTAPKERKSNSSLSSRMSNLSRRGLSFSFRASSRGSTKSEDEVWVLGDQCETVSLVTMRKDEALESECVLELPIGTTCSVVGLGEGRRMKIKAGEIEGWISSRTKMNEPLIMKRRQEAQFAIDDFEVGGQHEVKSMVTIRTAENLDSEVKSELKPGTLVRIVELGTTNKRRAKVAANDGVEGWISMATKQGELLIGKVTEHKPEKSGLFGASSSKIKTILEAARAGDIETIKKVVDGRGTVMSRFQSRPNLNCSDIRGKTPLIYAAAFGNKAVVAFLVEKPEVDINAMDDTQKSAMHHASKRARKRRDTVTTLGAERASIAGPGGFATDDTQAEIVDSLIKAKGYLEARDHNGCTALMFAVANGDESVMRVLLSANANANVKDFEGHTPLDYASNFGHAELVKILRDAGARGEDSEEEDDRRVITAPSSESTTAPPSEPTSPSAAPSNNSVMAGDGEGESASVSTAGASTTTAPKKKKSVVRKSTTKMGGDDAGEAEEAGASSSPTPKKATKKAGAKGKSKSKAGAKVAKELSMPSGMQEMREAQENVAKAKDAEIAVEIAPEEVEPEKVAVETAAEAAAREAKVQRELASQKLAAVLRESTSPKEVSKVIEDAVAAGVEGEEVNNAQKVLEDLKARAKARDGLLNAVGERDITMLKDAIKLAEAAGLADGEMKEAKRMLKEEEPKAEAMKKVKAAENAGDIKALKAAIEEAKNAKVDAGDLASYEALVSGSENKEKAAAMLKEAVANLDLSAMRFAIQQAKEAGIDTTEAENILKVEEPKQKAREQLAEACEKCTVDVLKAAISAAKAVKLDPSEYQEAEALIAAEEKKEQLIAGLKKVMEEVKEVDTTSIEKLVAAKAKLSDAITSAKEACVAEVNLADAELRRRKIHNGIEDLKGSIRVFCRVRPLSKKEVTQGDHMITKQVDAMTVECDKHQFGFDAVFTPGTQEEVFEDCRDLVQSAVDGYNVTMFAYGQTGAGKTFTMYGAPGIEGTSPRTIQELYRILDLGRARYTYTVMGSMLELYRNDLVDLLQKGDKSKTKEAAVKLNVRTDKQGMVMVEHLQEEECQSGEALSALLERGNKHRTVASTAMNDESSRSHLVLIIKIISVNKETKEQLRGKILICDLAGSERLKKSLVTAEMQKEAIEINKSLTALGDVIEALTKNAKQIPYRNHKLTQLMQDSLGGSAKTLMFVNCSPANSNIDETLMSLKYATRAKQIQNKTKKAKVDKAQE